MTAIRTVLRYLGALKSELGNPVGKLDAAHVGPTAVLLQGILAFLNEGASPERLSRFLFSPTAASGTDASAESVSPLSEALESIMHKIYDVRAAIQEDESLLLSPERAVEVLVAQGQVLRDIGKLLDSYQENVRRISGLEDQSAALARLRAALTGASEAMRAGQITQLRQVISTTSRPDIVTMVATFVVALERGLASPDSADLEALKDLSLTTTTVPSPEQIGPLQIASAAGLDRVAATLERIEREIVSASDKVTLSRLAHILRNIGVSLEQLLARIGALLSPVSESSPPPLLSARSESIDSVVLGKRQQTLDTTQELQNRLNSLRIDLESAPPPLLLTISRIASCFSKLMATAPAERETLVAQLQPNPASLATAFEIDPAVLNSLKSRSATVLDEARAFVFRERRGIAKARTIEELDAILHPMNVILTMVNFFLKEAQLAS